MSAKGRHRRYRKGQDLKMKYLFTEFPPFGAEGEEENPDLPPDPKPEPSNSNEDKGPKPPDNDDDDGDDEFSGYSAKELRRIARDLASGKKTAEQDRDSFKSKIDDQERSQRSKEENLERDNDLLRSENATLKATNAKLAITNAIICDTRYSWHNPEVVAQQLNSEVVKVGNDGKIEGLGNELKRIAKDHAYLLKETKPPQPPQPSPTGVQPGQGGANSGGNLPQNAQELAKKYPALASRL